jgi:hypothetical protein
MFGQFFVDPEDADPVELLDGEVVDPDELFEVLPPVAAVVLEVLEVAPDVLVAALATKAPPATRPLVSAPAASTLRRRSFMDGCPSFVMGSMAAPIWGTNSTLQD